MREWCPRRMSFHWDSKLADKQNGIVCREQFAFVLRGTSSFPRMGTGVCCVLTSQLDLNCLTVVKNYAGLKGLGPGRTVDKYTV